VKFIGRNGDQLVFEMTGREKSLFLAMLSLYPQVPESHHRLSRQAGLPDAEANQHLLEEAFKAQKAESQKWIAKTFKDPDRFKPGKTGIFYLTIQRSEMEMLLQIFNDVRIGSWLTLGSPGTAPKKKLVPTPQTAPFIQRMELAGAFEMFFLKTIRDKADGAAA
jgi:hypothetical protein